MNGEGAETHMYRQVRAENLAMLPPRLELLFNIGHPFNIYYRRTGFKNRIVGVWRLTYCPLQNRNSLLLVAEVLGDMY